MRFHKSINSWCVWDVGYPGHQRKMVHSHVVHPASLWTFWHSWHIGCCVTLTLSKCIVKSSIQKTQTLAMTTCMGRWCITGSGMWPVITGFVEAEQLDEEQHGEDESMKMVPWWVTSSYCIGDENCWYQSVSCFYYWFQVLAHHLSFKVESAWSHICDIPSTLGVA